MLRGLFYCTLTSAVFAGMFVIHREKYWLRNYAAVVRNRDRHALWLSLFRRLWIPCCSLSVSQHISLTHSINVSYPSFATFFWTERLWLIYCLLKHNFMTFIRRLDFEASTYIYTEWPKKCIHSLLINIFGINLNEISISGWECNIMFSQQMAQALL